MATSDTRGGVRIARQDALLCITLDRPAKRNAVDRAVADALEARYLATEHKRAAPVTPFDGWWRADADRWSL